MKTESTLIYLKDYAPHPFKILHSEILFELDHDATTVTAVHSVEGRASAQSDLQLDSEDLEILSISIDGEKVADSKVVIEDRKLTISDVPRKFTLEIINRICPRENTQLSGLYSSAEMLCTQCEAEGFRRITPAIDRPDNLATYTVTLSAPTSKFPVLLCNGNLMESRQLDDKNIAVWHDPFPKPTYLFALVAGELSELRSTFVTKSMREIDLRFYARDRDVEKCEYAMAALKRSMTWDEKVYGREYDLDRFNVVAVSDFNMGAMENKGLNIFNTKYVLADTNTATDVDFLNVESVVAHEYFHNWSGNRVTCRDWFQLSLKEGFTVFRDQEFSADMGSRGVQRIGDVNVLRNHQFPEDAGPMAHAVRPESYKEINNFYTVTIYEKGAEVVRMLRTLVGEAGFRRGTDLYFHRHDGEAVTTDDFVQAIADANDQDLTQFKNWYSQAGTPEVTALGAYDAENQSFSLTMTQSCADTPGQTEKPPFVIPVSTALFSSCGEKLYSDGESEHLLVLKERSQLFQFKNVKEPPIPSLLRSFSSPIKLDIEMSSEQLSVLFAHDDDPFNRWQAGQRLFELCILSNIDKLKTGKQCQFPTELTKSFAAGLTDRNVDNAFKAKLLALPGEAWLAELSKPIDPSLIAAARNALKQELAKQYQSTLLEIYKDLQRQNSNSIDGDVIATRSLRDLCLSYLSSVDDNVSHRIANHQLSEACCMTDRVSAFTALVNSTASSRNQVIEQFYQDWKHEELVVDKWFRIQAMSQRENTFDAVKELSTHAAFDHTNPNKIYSLILAFTQGNPAQFHRADAQGYAFLKQWVLKLDSINPQVAARLVSGLAQWKDYVEPYQSEMHRTLESLLASGPLSDGVSEILERSLK